jgi:outer membrane protein assembly factor BamA
VLSQPHRLAPLTLSFTRDHSNALFAPTNGSIFRFDGEFAFRGTGSDFSYWRAAADLSEYRQLRPGLVLAVRLHPGFARSLADPSAGQGLGLHPQKRFFAGGPNSVRGFAQYQLGPKVLTVDAVQHLLPDSSAGGAGCSIAEIEDSTCDISRLPSGDFDVRPVGGAALLEGSVELRFPLGISRLRGAAFADWGQLWTTAADVRLRGLVFTPGFGVRYFSAIGPIRVDVGYNPQGPESLKVYTTDVGARLPDGTVQCQRAADPAAGETATNCGQLYELDNRDWPPRGRFVDHLQLHFSIGQAF